MYVLHVSHLNQFELKLVQNLASFKYSGIEKYCNYLLHNVPSVLL